MSLNPDEILPYWCNRTAFLFRALFDQRAVSIGVKWAEGVILLKMSMGHNTLAELARNLEHSHPAILRHIDNLELSGLVERTGHPDDRRIKILVLTDLGAVKVQALHEMVRDISRDINERFGKERIAQTIALMKDIVSAFSDDAEPWCPVTVEYEQTVRKAGDE